MDCTSFDMRLKRNFKKLHSELHKLIKERREGRVEGWSPDDADILSVLMKSESYQDNDQLIVEECEMMFLAGSKSVQTATANLLMYLNHFPEVEKKLVAEIDEKLTPIKDDLMNGLTPEISEEF